MREDWRRAAIMNDCRELARLLSEGVPIDSRDRYGQTALMLAAQLGSADAASLLIDHGADMDVTAKYRLSALMLSIVNQHVKIAKLLVESGADTQIRGSGAPGFAGKTARDLALELGLDDLVVLLA